MKSTPSRHWVRQPQYLKTLRLKSFLRLPFEFLPSVSSFLIYSLMYPYTHYTRSLVICVVSFLCIFHSLITGHCGDVFVGNDGSLILKSGCGKILLWHTTFLHLKTKQRKSRNGLQKNSRGSIPVAQPQVFSTLLWLNRMAQGPG